MKRKIECEECAFYREDGFQDMGSHSDVCLANQKYWDFIEKRDGGKKPTEHCPYALVITEALRQARERWKRDSEENK